MSLSLKDEATALRAMPGFGKYFASLLRKVEDAVNGIGKSIGVNPTGTMPAPQPIHAVNVKTSSDGYVHATITDNNAISKNLQYFLEVDTDPAFGKPHVIDLGASRSALPFKLPALNDTGGAQNFYVRGYSQPHGGPAGKKVNYGGTTPTAITPGGTTQMSLLSSTGSGTASPFGTQGGQGLGTVLNRPAVGPKRQSPMIQTL